MASSKVMASTSPANSDLPRQSSIHTFTVCDFQADPANRSFGSMNMDELLKNMYDDSDSFPSNNGAPDGGGGSGRCPAADCAGNSGGLHAQRNNGNKMDDVWKEMVTGSAGDNRGDEEMTLEDYLTKAGAVREEDVRPRVIPPPGYGVESMMNVAQFQVPGHMQSGQNGPGGYGVEPVGFGNGIDGTVVAVGASGGSAARGKRRLVDEQPLDRATQQKQRRMIKNRESAARSRERKQAYTIELESLVTQLEEENARLLREEAELIRERYQQLMDNLIPIIEEKRPPRVLRRVCSMGW